MTIRRIGRLREGQRYASVSQEDSVIRVDGMTYDPALMQEESEVVYDVRKNGCFVATLTIPGRRYRQTADENEEIRFEGEPLDIETVTVSLWPIEAELAR